MEVGLTIEPATLVRWEMHVNHKNQVVQWLVRQSQTITIDCDVFVKLPRTYQSKSAFCRFIMAHNPDVQSDDLSLVASIGYSTMLDLRKASQKAGSAQECPAAPAVPAPKAGSRPQAKAGLFSTYPVAKADAWFHQLMHPPASTEPGQKEQRHRHKCCTY